jgi:hypothetical protein
LKAKVLYRDDVWIEIYFEINEVQGYFADECKDIKVG